MRVDNDGLKKKSDVECFEYFSFVKGTFIVYLFIFFMFFYKQEFKRENKGEGTR